MASLVICMAGLNTRFHNVGFDIPKYLLPWKDETIIHEILKNLNSFDDVVLVANKRDEYFRGELLKTIEPLGLHSGNVIYIGDTDGQAHTAYIGCLALKNQTDSFFIHNADTILMGRKLNDISFADAYIDVFVANNPSYSYVRTSDGLALDIVEKSAISPFASSGLYGFRSGYFYLESYESLSYHFSEKEMYIANVLSDIIKKQYSVNINSLSNDHETIVLGTPQEYGIEITKQAIKKW